MSSRKGLGLANQVTLGRGVLTLIVWVLLTLATRDPSEGLIWTAFVLFSLAAATDFVDGALARRMQDVSVFGRIADPLVDKMLTIGTMIVVLAFPVVHPALPPWIVACMLVRELLVTALRAAVESQGGNFQASWAGKWKMTVQSIAAGAAILFPLGYTWANIELGFLDFLPGGASAWTLAHAITWAAFLLTLWSAVPYVRRALGMLRSNGAS